MELNVIGRKNGSFIGYAIMCFAVSIAGLLGGILGMLFLPMVWYAFLSVFLLPAICLPVGLYCMRIVKMPNDLIFIDGEKIVLHDGRKFTFGEVRDISYKHASSRYGTYRYGWITFDLKSFETIKVYPVSDVEEVGKKLSRLIYGNTSNA